MLKYIKEHEDIAFFQLEYQSANKYQTEFFQELQKQK